MKYGKQIFVSNFIEDEETTKRQERKWDKAWQQKAKA